MGARGRLELRRRERCRVGSGLSQDGANLLFTDHGPITSTIVHPSILRAASEQLAEVRAYNGQQVKRRTMCRKCTKNVHKMCTTAAAAQWPEHTGVGWRGSCVPTLFSSLVVVVQIPLCLPYFNYHSIVDSLITLSDNFQLLFNCDQTQCQNFNGSSQFPIYFYHPNLGYH